MNQNIKYCPPPHIYSYVYLPIHVSDLLISLWGLANQICHALWETATCRLRTKADHVKIYNLTPQLAVNNTYVWFDLPLRNISYQL